MSVSAPVLELTASAFQASIGCRTCMHLGSVTGLPCIDWFHAHAHTVTASCAVKVACHVTSIERCLPSGVRHVSAGRPEPARGQATASRWQVLAQCGGRSGTAAGPPGQRLEPRHAWATPEPGDAASQLGPGKVEQLLRG